MPALPQMPGMPSRLARYGPLAELAKHTSARTNAISETEIRPTFRGPIALGGYDVAEGATLGIEDGATAHEPIDAGVTVIIRLAKDGTHRHFDVTDDIDADGYVIALELHDDP